MRRIWAGLCIAGALWTGGASLGCAKLHYLSQAAHGQRDIALRTRSLDDVIADPRTPPDTRELLERIPAIKRFAIEHGLRPTTSYEGYAYLPRPAAVWVVTACEPLRFRSKTWSFPIAGRVPYLGWFDKKEAEELARELAREGWDVDVRGAAAYSTLGWFADPVLSTMLDDGPQAVGELANTVLHESLHATFYVPGQTALNESVASFVGDGLALEYLDRVFGPTSTERKAYVAAEERRAARAQAMQEAVSRLEALYGSNALRSVKLAEKRVILGELRAKTSMRRAPNNATLAGFRAYNTGHEELERLFLACGRSWPTFLTKLESLRRSDDPTNIWTVHVRRLAEALENTSSRSR